MGLLVRRHTPEDGSGRSPALRRVTALATSCLLFSVTYTASSGVTAPTAAASGAATVVCSLGLVGIVAATVSFNWLPRHNHPKNGFKTPLVPYLPAVGVMVGWCRLTLSILR